MRKLIVLSSATALVLCSCGPKKLALPSDPIERAATCAVVSAAASREGETSVKGNLDPAAQMRILHYALLAGSEGKAYSADAASAVVKKMKEMSGPITDGKWQDLKPACDEAYPVVAKTDGIELPAVKFDAQLACYAMGDFLVRAGGATDQKTSDVYAKMHRDLDAPIGAGLKARGASSYEKTQRLKNEALSHTAKLGALSSVMKLCTGRFA